MDRHTINLEFFASYELFEQIPSLNCQEIAFVGASNSGKSSAINLLANNKKLSYTSKKPGKTKLFNYFKKDNNFIVDFPGYGFANISKSQIKSWQRELPRYFEKRENLKYAFSHESQANRRYLYFAQKADIEGYNDVATVFRSTAEGETGHAHGHLEYLEQVGDPATGKPIGETKANLESAVAGETHEYTDMYPGMAKTAREEGFEEIADWFETLAKAEKSHAGKFQKTLESIS